jgi:predicted Zn-dependent protease
MLVRDLSKIENIRIVDRPAQDREAHALLARLSLDRDGAGLRLTTELVDSRSGAILLAESYRYDPRSVDRALAHFANNTHAIITGLSLQLGSGGLAPQSGVVHAAYARAFRLWRQGDRQSLDAASSTLNGLLADRGDVPLAASLLARVKADLVLHHGSDISLAREARRDAARLVAAHPDIGEFRYSLARALLALGEHRMALDQLQVAQQTMPFLSRDIQALKQREP